MTREEFAKDKPNRIHFECWIAYELLDTRSVRRAYYFSGNYYDEKKSSNMYRKEGIKAVMPIKKPEYPKEVG
jgi:hypothetical protein